MNQIAVHISREQSNATERKWRSNFSLDSGSLVPFPPADRRRSPKILVAQMDQSSLIFQEILERRCPEMKPQKGRLVEYLLEHRFEPQNN
jgi:hypothetical protein